MIDESPHEWKNHFADHIFKWIFLKVYKFRLKFVSTDSQQYPSIGSDNDSAPTTRQAIIWTNDG